MSRIRLRAYLVGQYCYSVPRRERGIACVWRDWRSQDGTLNGSDTLPPTMIDIVTVWAPNKRAAVASYRSQKWGTGVMGNV